VEKHYLSKRSRRQKGILAFLAQDAQRRVFCYANAQVRKAGGTALSAAAYYGHEEVILLLLNAEPDPMIRDHRGHTAEEYASEAGHAGIATLLRDA